MKEKIGLVVKASFLSNPTCPCITVHDLQNKHINVSTSIQLFLSVNFFSISFSYKKQRNSSTTGKRELYSICTQLFYNNWFPLNIIIHR